MCKPSFLYKKKRADMEYLYEKEIKIKCPLFVKLFGLHTNVQELVI